MNASESEVEYYWDEVIEPREVGRPSDIQTRVEVSAEEEVFGAIHLQSSAISFEARPFSVTYTGDSFKKSHYAVSNSFAVVFELQFEFGEKAILSRILRSLSYLGGAVNHDFLADLLEAFHPLQRDLYQCTLRGKCQIGGLKGGYMTFWRTDDSDQTSAPDVIEMDDCDSLGVVQELEIELALRNRYYANRKQCAVFHEGGDTYTDLSGYSQWPLCLSVWNDKDVTPQQLDHTLAQMVDQTVTSSVERRICGWYQVEENCRLGHSKVSGRVEGHIDVQMLNESTLAEWMQDSFTNQCVVSYPPGRIVYVYFS